ncbi:MAG: hypothetical protein JXR23_03825 [Pontiellaceae bacterium]|nr:hypothetical protein [Pontiellaceae bacterium]
MTGIIIAIIVIVAIVSIPFELRSKKRLEVYWQRRCTGTEWRNRFPDAPKESIRDFLQIFVDGFAFRTDQRLKFSPEDKIMDVYRTLYPTNTWPDALEFETFAISLEDKYGFDLEKIAFHEITLGQLFEITRNTPQQTKGI